MTHERAAPVSTVRVGVDENGLGPRLGPLVVTAVWARVTPEGRAFVARGPRGKLATRLGDSKAMVAHGDVALGEAWARAVVRRSGSRAASAVDLVRALSLASEEDLRAPCPPHVAAQCWDDAADAPLAANDDAEVVARDLRDLARRGVDVVGARASIVCTHRLNVARAGGASRFDVDLHEMERLVLAVAEHTGGEVNAVCGKVGGYSRYGDAFGPVGGRLHVTLEEGRARSAYRFPGVGALAFVRDADATDVLVALASMIGKWLREALMARIVRFYDQPGETRRASGYHDPVTERFIAATALARASRGVPTSCFERAAPEALPRGD